MPRCLLLFVFLFVGCTHNNIHRGEEPEKLVIEDRPQKKLEIHFHNFVDSLGVEFAFCAYGRIERNILLVESIEFPPQYQDYAEVYSRYDLCSPNAVAIGHAHPDHINNFIYSSTDWETLKERPEPAGILMFRNQVTDEINFDLFTP